MAAIDSHPRAHIEYLARRDVIYSEFSGRCVQVEKEMESPEERRML